MSTQTDPRYKSRRWKATREQVLARDLWRCQVVPGCEVTGDVCDHIDPVYDGMPDVEFFDPTNLRASCKRHNTARGVAARLQRELAGVSEVRKPALYSYGRRRLVSRGVF